VQGLWRRGAVALLAFLCCQALATRARADEIIDVGPSPVLNLHVNRGQVNIETWNRPQVSIASERPLDVRHLAPSEVDSVVPRQLQMESQTVQTEHGPVVLPAESFVLPELSPMPHDAILANGTGNVTIMIPRGTAMVLAHQRGGHLTITNYRGVFIAHTHKAMITLDRVSGTGYVESLKGRIVATNSSFERLRVRTATGDMLFRNCTSHQIQANSAYGSIVYDNGHFQPGLARFESDHGNVALGISGGAQIGAHSGSGHVVSSFRNEADVRGNLATKQARVRGGGPVVTATSKNGSVYLYSGSMRDHPRVRQELNGSARLPGRYQPPPARLPFRHPPIGRRRRR
jgi:hypothetical protein